MSSMEIDRRSLMLGTIALMAPASANVVAGPGLTGAAFASAAKHGDGTYVIVLLTADGRVVREIPLSARGHDIAIDAGTGRAVAFSRRPGTLAVAFDTAHVSQPQIFTAAEGRHFYGHGAFSRDGRLLYASENDIAGARGVIGIYDVARSYAKIGEHASFGLGPHEIILLADGKTLAVANGGLDTVPDSGRENLNLDAMQPSLVFVDAASGALRAKHALSGDLKRLSLRHIAADWSGRVWFGGQWEGDPGATPSLIGFADRDTGLKLIAPPAASSDLKGYIGSVAASAAGRIIAASAPKAGRVIYIDAASGKVTAECLMKDACGIAPDRQTDFAITSGFGDFRHDSAGAAVIAQTQLVDVAFDNHLRRVS